MRIIVTPAGSRGDFQPLLALAVALSRSGHQVTMLASPDFAVEARAFGVDAHPLGVAAEAHVKEAGFSRGPLRGALALMGLGRRLVGEMVDAALPLVEGADCIVGAGAQIVAPTLAEAIGRPYLYVAYTPQMVRSRHHAPITVPWLGLPQWANRLLWWSFGASANLVLGAALNRKRRALGLPAVSDVLDHIAPRHALAIAADPELAVVPADLTLVHPLTGALHLPDERVLPAELEAFLARGEAPIYVGFGSMPDLDPEPTTRLLIDAARRAGRRLVLSSGWAGYGGVRQGAKPLADDVVAVGPASHALLFPRVAAVVHHGGAGTSSAALKAGRPQLVVPHLFDQFQWGEWIARAGLGPPPIAKRRLDAAALGTALRALLEVPRFAQRAHELARAVRARDSAAELIATLERVVERWARAAHA